MAAAAATQLAIPGVLVSVFSPGPGAPVDDRSLWQRAVLRASLSSAAKLVGLALASHTASTDDGIATCAPGLATLVTETGYSRTHVQRQISTLRTRGWLVGVNRPASGRPARFALSLPASVAAELQRSAPAAAPAATSSEPAATSSGTTSAPLRRRGRGRPGGGPVAGRPSAAARRRARITGPALAKALTVPAGGVGAELAGSQVPPAGPRSTVDAADDLRGASDGPSSDSAAWQILSTLARAMRCGEDDFGDASARLTAVLDGGRWSAAALATHLVDFVVGGVMVAGADPADSLGWRLDRLPVSENDCACRSCRSWQQRPVAPSIRQPAATAAATTAVATTTAGTTVATPAASQPALAAIEQAAAAGTAQARLRATGAA